MKRTNSRIGNNHLALSAPEFLVKFDFKNWICLCLIGFVYLDFFTPICLPGIVYLEFINQRNNITNKTKVVNRITADSKDLKFTEICTSEMRSLSLLLAIIHFLPLWLAQLNVSNYNKHSAAINVHLTQGTLQNEATLAPFKKKLFCFIDVPRHSARSLAGRLHCEWDLGS